MTCMCVCGVRACVCLTPHNIYADLDDVIVHVVGGPMDLMSRRVLCAGTQELANQIAASLEQLDLQRDDCA